MTQIGIHKKSHDLVTLVTHVRFYVVFRQHTLFGAP